MNTVKAWIAGAPSAWVRRDEWGVLALFTATIFLSAALLFSVQPMFAKMVLPTLGGSPSVWAVSLCFFQAVLLFGYCYAHALNRFLDGRTALVVHALVLAVAALSLPIGLPEIAHGAPTGSAYLWLIGVLSAGVGLPFFAVSANAPLLQAWFARTGHPHAADPYFLYAASNIGSLLALLAYPALIEPALGLGVQGAAWSGGFAVLATAIALCGAAMLAGRESNASAPQAQRETTLCVRATAGERAVWVGLAFVPSALLVALTTFLTTDIASAPFLWVIPLALFLGTFVLVFRGTPVIPQAALIDRQPLLAALAIFGVAAVNALDGLIGFAAGLLAFVVTSLVCHRELYLRRPPAAGLTEFYLWMSFGGVLGGIFSALVAPQVFTSIFEFPLLVCLGLLARPSVAAAWRSGEGLGRAVLVAGAGLAVLVAIACLISAGVVAGHVKLRIFAIAILFAALLVWRRSVALEMSLFALMLGALVILPEGGGAKHAVRSFFGVHRVVETPDGNFRMLMHGTTAHGAERRFDGNGKALAAPMPVSYYYPQGPMARSLALARDAAGTGAPRFGVVGLGAGSIACHAKAGEAWRFFEIDQAVVDIARDPTLFRFLSHCQPRSDIVVGDARLTLAREGSGSFDYLLIDAFSSDAIPMHLMTVEALELYLDKLTPGGVLALHISNRHMDLAPVVAANVAEVPGLAAVFVEDAPDKPGLDSAPSAVALVSRRAESIAPALAWRGARPLTPSGPRAWTDDYSDALSALLRRWTR